MSKMKNTLFDPKDYCQPRTVGNTKIYLHLTKPFVVISAKGENQRLSYAEALIKKRRMSRRDFPTEAQFKHETSVIDTCIELLQWQKALPLTQSSMLIIPLLATLGDKLIGVIILLYALAVITLLLWLLIDGISKWRK